MEELIDRSDIDLAAKAIDIDSATYLEDQNMYTCRMTVEGTETTEECMLRLDVKCKYSTGLKVIVIRYNLYTMSVFCSVSNIFYCGTVFLML